MSSTAPRMPSRRQLIAALGGAAGLLPLGLGRRARAATPAWPTRLVIITWPNGAHPPTAVPATNGPLTIDPASSLTPFAPFAKKAIFMGGLATLNQLDSGSNNGHQAAPFLLTGVKGAPFEGTWDGVMKTAGGPSIDQHIAKGLKAAGVNTPLPSLVIRQEYYKGNDGYISIAGPPIANKVNAVTPENDPKVIFNRLFGAAPPSGTSSDAAHRAAARKSVLDHVASRLQSLAAGFGAADRDTLAAHLQAVRDLETEIQAPAGGCAAPPAPNPADYTAKDGSLSSLAVLGPQAQLVTAALACDLTRVVTMNWTGQVPAFSFTQDDKGQPTATVPDGKTGPGTLDEHGLAHKQWDSDADGMRRTLVDRWFFTQIASFLARLDAIQEGDGTLLDHSVVVVTSQMGDGANHVVGDVPWLLFGGANGFFKTGQVLRWPSGTPKVTLPQTRLLLALSAALGVPGTGFADPAYAGDLPGVRA